MGILCVAVLLLLLSLVCTQSPFGVSNPNIQSGSVTVILSSNIKADTNCQDLGGNELCQARFPVTFRKVFLNSPQIALSIKQYQYDQTRFSTTLKSRMSLITEDIKMLQFKLRLYLSKHNHQFVNHLTMMYIAIDMAKVQEVLTMDRQKYETTEGSKFKKYADSLQDKKQYYQYQREATGGSVTIMAWIAGHFSNTANITYIYTSASHRNTKNYTINYQFSSSCSISIVVVYVLAIDQTKASLYFRQWSLDLKYFHPSPQISSTILPFIPTPDQFIAGPSIIYIINSPNSNDNVGFKILISSTLSVQWYQYFNYLYVNYLTFRTLQCSNGLYVNSNSTCLPQCPMSHVQEDRFCTTCNVTYCKYCINTTNCSICKQFRKIYQNQCLCLEPFLNCTNLSTATSCNNDYCYLDPKIQFQLKLNSLSKDPQSNSLIYNVFIQPQLQFLNEIDFSKAFSAGLPGQASIFSYTYKEGQLEIRVEYTENVHNLETNLSIHLLKTQLPSFRYSEASTVNYTVIPDNNLAANFYSDNVYKYIKAVTILTYVIIGVGSFFFLLGLYSSKVVVLEMMGVIQISFLGILLVDTPSPLFAPLSFLQYGNGFNSIFPKTQGDVPNKLFFNGYTGYFYQNINLMTTLIALPLMASLFFYVLSKVKRIGKTANESMFKLCLGEWCLTAVLFSLYNFCTSVAVYFSYDMPKDTKFIGSVVEMVVYSIVALTNFILFGLKDYNFFGEFKYMFKWTTFDTNFYYLHIGIRIVFGVVIGLFYNHYYSGVAVSVCLLVMSVVTIIKKPYADILQSVRSSLVMLLAAIITGLNTVMAVVIPQSGSSILHMIPLFTVSLLTGVVAISGGFVIRQLIINIKDKLKEKQDSSDLVEEETRKHEELMRQKMEQMMREETNNNFATKLFLNKSKKPRKRKTYNLTIDPVAPNAENGGQIGGQLNNFGAESPTLLRSGVNQQDGVDELQDGLTVRRVMEVDRLLREGLV